MREPGLLLLVTENELAQGISWLFPWDVLYMNLLHARGQFVNWIPDRNFQEFGLPPASQGATAAMGSMNCHPGDPRLLGAFAEHLEALELAALDGATQQPEA